MHHWGFFPPIGFIFFLFLIALFFANIRMWRGRRGCHYRTLNHEPMLILDKRLASGEIDVEEYHKLKGILNKK